MFRDHACLCLNLVFTPQLKYTQKEVSVFWLLDLPCMHILSLFFLPLDGATDLPEVLGPHLCDSEAPCDWTVFGARIARNCVFSAPCPVPGPPSRTSPPGHPLPVPGWAGRRRGEFMSKQSRLCADGDVVSVAWLPESG